jgi:sister chromatid cohesion protein DCC1
MSLYSLQYADDPGPSTQTSYSLIELPPAFAKAANERDLSNGVLASLTIKGQPSDEAVLCTQNTTYNIRSVQNSNSLLLCQASTSSSTSGSNKGKKVEVQTTLHQTLELEPTIPKLEKISDLLRGQEWIPEDDVEEERQPKVTRSSLFYVCVSQRRKTRRYTFEDVIDLVPASDAQIENALKGKRVLIIDGG